MAYFIVNSLNMHIENLSIVEDFLAMNAFELSFDVRGESVVAQSVSAIENSPTFVTFVFIVRVGAMMVLDVLL